MLPESIFNLVPVFLLVTCRVGAFMLFAPLFGSKRIPKRVKALLVVTMAFGLTPLVAVPPKLPLDTWDAAIGILCEMGFGLGMGMILSFVFIAAQWAGEIIGQQIGFNLAETFDPQFGGGSSLVGDLYYMLTLVVFLSVHGHRAMIEGLRDSFKKLPLLGVGVDQNLFDLIIKMFGAATEVAMRLAGPVLVTMIVVDLMLGFLGKTMPQLNIMSANVTVKSVVGLLVLMIGIGLYMTTEVIQTAIDQSMQTVRLVWAGK